MLYSKLIFQRKHNNRMEKRTSIHGQWSSRWAFILATTGAAVGLGNIWKFPYIAGENGGGAFVCFYLLCIAVIGVPLMMAEVLLGRHGRQNPANSMRSLAIESGRSRHWGAVGFIAILAGFLILSYYAVVAGWALDYVFQAAMGHFTQGSAEHIDSIFNQLIASPWQMLLWDSILMVATISVVAMGVEKGLERSIRYVFPAMLVLLFVIIIYSYETGEFGKGISFLFHPNFKALTPSGMLIALGHAFFTLSLATGSIMMYGAYLPDDISIPKTTLFIAAADTFIALVAGLAIFPIVFAHGLEPGAGPGLIFKTLPIAFGQMPYGRIFATLFFIMLVFAAFTSAISLLEPSVAWMVERLQITRRKAAILVGFGIWFFSLGTIFSFNIWANVKLFGLNVFDLLDYLTSNIMLPIGGLLTAVFAAWLLKRELVDKEFRTKGKLLYRTWHYCLGIITPIAIVVVFLHAIHVI